MRRGPGVLPRRLLRRRLHPAPLQETLPMRRRGSLLGPIVILIIGVMFLVRNFRPDIPVWQLFGQYWPLLLIFLGLLKLMQAISPQDPAVPQRPLISGGEVFLIIMLCIFG